MVEPLLGIQTLRVFRMGRGNGSIILRKGDTMAKKILIADDQRELVEGMKVRFEKDGYTVVEAFNGEECLEKAKKEIPDLIIMDVSMPQMDGYEAVREIKADKTIKHIPIFMLTGKDQMEDIFRLEGVLEYIIKPFDYEMLSGLIKTLFKD
jgi:CheY-like chemotaxis protein